MCKKALTDMPVAVDHAIHLSRELAQMRSRGPGDLVNAMRSIEREYGIDYWTQWTLRYRPTRFKDIGIELFGKLRAAYQAECAHQQRRLQHEMSIARQIAGPDHPALREAEAVVADSPEAQCVQTNIPNIAEA